MATKSFKDICVEYAHQLGKGLPLTPVEMCNAVIMYLNQQVDTMNQYVQTALNAVKDLQTEIADIDLSDYVTLNTDQTINGEKTFTDSQFFNKGLTAYGGKISGSTLVASDTGSGTSQSRVEILYNKISNIKNGTIYSQAFQTKNGTIALTSDIPDIPEPTTSDNGKVIGVQNGAYALVEHIGGEAPANMVTTNTQQTIIGQKTFQSYIKMHSLYNVYNSVFYEAGTTPTGYTHNVGDPNTDIIIKGKQDHLQYNDNNIANTSDIPNLDDYDGNIHIINSAIGNGISVHNTSKTSPHTKYKYNKIEIYSNLFTLQWTLDIPEKSGTIALLSDIKNVNYSSFLATDNNSNIAVSFACITTTNLGGEIAYSELNSTICGLGYNDENNVLPASGIINSKNVYGIWSDGTTIHCLCTDFTQEDLPDNATTTVKSV